MLSIFLAKESFSVFTGATSLGLCRSLDSGWEEIQGARRLGIETEFRAPRCTEFRVGEVRVEAGCLGRLIILISLFT